MREDLINGDQFAEEESFSAEQFTEDETFNGQTSHLLLSLVFLLSFARLNRCWSARVVDCYAVFINRAAVCFFFNFTSTEVI